MCAKFLNYYDFHHIYSGIPRSDEQNGGFDIGGGVGKVIVRRHT